MGRLAGKAPGSRLGPAPSRLRAPPTTEVERDRSRAEAAPWRSWYTSARWRRLRERVLLRDGWQCQRTGVLLVPGRVAPNAAVIHHKEPHRGDPDLFWDEANCEAVAKEWHDGPGQAAEWRRG